MFHVKQFEFCPCARSAALCVLERVAAGQSAQSALDSVLRTPALSPADAALCTELVYGCLRLRLRLEFVLAAVLPRPQSLPLRLRLLLMLAVYAMLFLERVPDYASVHWTVDAVRAMFGQGLARVANAALRAVQRLGDAPLYEDFYTAGAANLPKGPLEGQARFYAVPLWIATLWEQAYGYDATVRLMRRSSARPVTALRLNKRHSAFADLSAALQQSVGGFETRPYTNGRADPAPTKNSTAGLLNSVGAGSARPLCVPPPSPPATVISPVPDVILGQSLDMWHTQGAFSWQSAGSQYALHSVKHWQYPIWDACAGQGGKALACIEAGHEVLVCSDINAQRLARLRREAARLVLPALQCVRASALHLPVAQWPGTIFLDVPCSGLGTLARRPEIRERMSPERVQGLIHLQRHILEAAWARLSAGGQIVYITCTVNPAENEEQIRDFCTAHADAALNSQWSTPLDHPWLEGMFAASIVKAHCFT